MAVARDSSVKPLDLAGKVAVVTGASSGIGLATTEALVARGVRVAMLARDPARLESAAAPFGESVVPVPTDVANPTAVRAAFVAVDRRCGRLDILVNNAGLAKLGTVEELGDEELSAQVGTNFLGLVHCAREAIPRLRAAGGGDIVNVSSTAVNDPYPFLSIYAATKAAVEMFTVALRREVKGDGTRVTLLRCGPAWTAFGFGWDPDALQRALRSWSAGGYPGFDGSMDASIVGEAVAHAVAYPRQASMEIVEIDPTIHAPRVAPQR